MKNERQIDNGDISLGEVIRWLLSKKNKIAVGIVVGFFTAIAAIYLTPDKFQIKMFVDLTNTHSSSTELDSIQDEFSRYFGLKA